MAEMMSLLTNMLVLVTDVVQENHRLMKAYSHLVYENGTLSRQSQRWANVSEDDSIPMSEVDGVIRKLRNKLCIVQELRRKVTEAERILLADDGNDLNTEDETEKGNIPPMKKARLDNRSYINQPYIFIIRSKLVVLNESCQKHISMKYVSCSE